MTSTSLSVPSGRRLLRSGFLLPALLIAIVAVLVVAPLLRILLSTLTPEGLEAWQAVLASRLSANLWWRPLLNTMILGFSVAGGCLLMGGFLAWLVVLTDVPGRRFLALMATLPYMIPSFAAALAWGTLFRNSRLGGSAGFFETSGLAIPDWLAWGLIPTAIVLVAHYYSLAYTIIAAALSSVGADLVEAGQMAGAKRPRIFFGIILPVVTPALIAVSALFLFLSDRIVSGRKAFITVTGKGGRTKRFPLGSWRWPLFALAVLIGLLTTVTPVLVLAASSLAPQSGALFSNWTLHFWIGEGGVEAGLVAAEGQLLLGAGAVVGLCVQLFIVAVVQGVVDAVLAPVVDQAVAGDLEQPRAKTRPALWLGGAADQAEPGVLVDFFGQFGFVAQGHEEAVQALAVARVQGFEGARVTGSVAGQQRFVAG